MTNEAADAIAALKAKLDILKNAGDSLVALGQAAKVANDSFVALAGAKYVHVSMNADWDPNDHPRDPNTGEFIKTLGGFIFGKAKKAKYKANGTDTIELDLAPGDVAFQTPAKNVIISHADGSYSLIGYLSPKDIKSIPAGSNSNIAAMSEQGKLVKIAENPGVKVNADTKAEAADKLEHPDHYSDASQSPSAGSGKITDPPPLKSGKKAHTAKQYADYQSENLGKVLFKGKDGKDVTSGSWIDVGGKPLLVHASPLGAGKISVYRWVKTKQQASNLVKEDFLTADDLKKAFAIDDPTGKPYGVDVDAEATKTTKVKVGSLMSQAVTGAIPNTATAHKKHAESSVGTLLTTADDGMDTLGAQFLTVKPSPINDVTTSGIEAIAITGGSWVEIEGKPFRVFASPNPGNIALAKWVSTKQQASNNTYDFPVSVLSEAVLIKDPTGKDYTPLPVSSGDQDAPKTVDAPEEPDTLAETQEISDVPLADWEKDLLGISENPDETPVITADSVVGAPVGTKVVLTYPGGTQTKYEKKGDNSWQGASILVPDWSVQSAFGVLKFQSGSTIEWTEPGKDTVTVTSSVLQSNDSEEIPEDLSAVDSDVLAMWEPPASYTVEDDTDLSTLPLGSVLTVNDGLYGYWYKQMGGWSLYDENGVKLSGDSVQISSKSDVSSSGISVLASPAKSVKAAEFVSKFGIENEEASVFYNDHMWTLKDNQWTADTGTIASNASVIESLIDKATEAQAIHNAILTLEPGDSVIVDYYEGQVATYEVQDDGTISQGPTALPISLASMAAFPLKPAWQKTASFTIQKKEAAPAFEKDPDVQPINNAFVHPVSGVVFTLNPGDKVWKHKKTDNYIIETTDPDTPINFFFNNGKAGVPKASHKSMKENYEVVETWPGKKDGEGSSADGDAVATSTPITATPDHVDAAVAGDKIQFAGAKFGKSVYIYEKQANGEWQQPNGYALGSDLMKDTISKGFYTTTFIPAVVMMTTVDPDADPKAPWGGSESLGDNPEPFKKPTSKKSKKQDLPKSFTLPSGNTIDLGPGEILVKTTSGGEEYYVQVFPAKGQYNNVFNSTGTPVTHWTLNSWTPAKAKSYIKSYGGEILAEKPLIKIDQDLSSYSAYDDDYMSALNWKHPDSAAYSLIQNKIKSELHPIVPVNWGSIGYNNTSLGKPWSDLTPDERTSLISQFADTAGRLYATLTKVSEDHADEWEKSEKAKNTKYKNSIALIHRIATLASQISDPDTEWDEETFESEISFLTTKASQGGVVWPDPIEQVFPAVGVMVALKDADNQRKFKKSLSGLSFDPYNGTAEDYDTYAKSKGFDYLAALDLQQQKVWVLADLGDPVLSPSTKASIKKVADNAKTKVVIAGISASLTKGKPSADPLVEPPKGLWEKAHLKASYAWKDKDGHAFSAKNIGDDEWEFTSTGTAITVTDAVVQTLINGLLIDGTDFYASDNYAYGDSDVASQVQKLADKYGLPSIGYAYASSHAYIAAELGAKVAFTSNVALRRWLYYRAIGDQLGMYTIEKGQKPNLDLSYSIGSPTSQTGAIAWRTLANQILGMPGGAKYLTDGSTSSEFRQAIEKNFPIAADGEYLSISAWVADHPWETLKSAIEAGIPTGDPGQKPTVMKPFTVSQETWDFVQYLTPATDLSDLYGSNTPLTNMTNQELTTALNNSTNAKSVGLHSLFVSAIPEHLKRLAVWASSNSDDANREEVLAAIAAKAKAGEFLENDTPVWIAPDGTAYPISPGASVYKSDKSYIVSGPPLPDGSPSKDGFLFDNGTMSVASKWVMNALESNGYTKVFTMPNAVSWDQAYKDNPDLDINFWDAATSIENGNPSPVYKSYDTGAVLTAALKNNAKLQESYPNLYAQHKTLPENIRQAIAGVLDKGKMNPAHYGMLDVMEYKALKGHYASMQSKGLFDLSQPWVKNLSMGQVTDADVQQHWSLDAKNHYVAHFNLKGGYGEIAAHIDSLLNPATVVPDTRPSWSDLPDWSSLTFTPTGKKLGGMHTKYHLVDQFGNEWMQKTFESDKSMAPYRIEAEVGALKIGSLFGFRGPVAGALHLHEAGGGSKSVGTSGGTYSYVQYLKGGPGTTDMVGHGPNDLSLKQLQQAMEEHLLDWITANHDTHQQNLRFDDDGSVFGIDKGQAFKHFPNDKLAVGYLPPENGEAVWYDKFYKALQNGQISKEKADEVTKHVLRRALKISKDKDEEFRELLNEALAKRPMWPDQFPTKEKFIDALVERKHNAFDDFVEFYKNLYKASPYDFDIDTENLVPPMLDKHTHIAISQELADEVKKSGNHGKALFFNSTNIEDSHFLLYTGKEKNGTTTLLGETKVRADGDKQLLAWLKKQTIDDQSGSYQAQSYTPVISKEYEEMPKNVEFFSAMVAYSKTVSSHNASGDKAYNSQTLQNAGAQHMKILEYLGELDLWEKANPDKPFVHKKQGVELHTMEQHVAWKSMLQKYKEYYEIVKKHEGKDTKVSPHFTQFVYAPTNAAKAQFYGLPESPSDAPEGFKIKDLKGEVWEKTSANAWKNLSTEKLIPNTKMSADWFNGITSASDEDVQKIGEKSKTVTIGTKTVKVTRKPNMVRTGKFDIDSGELTMNEEFSSTYYSTTLQGYMYEIDFGDVKILYHAHEPETKPTDLGRLTFEKRNWNGDATSMDEIFDVLRQVGLSLDPADEESMELFYWRQLTGVLSERKSKTVPKWKKVIETVKNGKIEDMAVTDELALYRQAWGEAIGEDRVKNANWMPQFSASRLYSQDKDEEGVFTSGHPYWLRPDMTPAEAKAKGIAPATHSITYGGNANNFYKIVMSGGLFSAEEKWRFFGATNAVDGKSSYTSGTLGGVSPESDYLSHGSSGQIFTYAAGSSKSNGNVYLHPKTLFRTTNYVAASDSYGDQQKKLSSPWEISEINDPSNYELMVKNMLSVLDDMALIEFATQAVRDEAIKEYKARGITTIHGLPIEDIFVVEGQVSNAHRKKVYDKLWDDLIAEQENLVKEKANG